MGPPARRPRQLKGGKSGSRPRIVYARGVPAEAYPQIYTFNRFPHPFRDRLLQGSWLPRKIQPKDRQVPPLTHCPPTILGTRRVCLHPHRPRRHHHHRHRERLRVRPCQGRPSIAAQRKRKGHKTPDTSSTALLYDKRIAKTLLNKLCSQAQTILLGIIAHKQKKIREQEASRPNSNAPDMPSAMQMAPRHPPTHTPRPHRTTNHFI